MADDHSWPALPALIESSTDIARSDDRLARRLRYAHALARFSVRLPRPLMWLGCNVLCSLLVPALRGRRRCPTMYGFDLFVRSTNGSQYYRCGFYEQGTMHVIEKCLRAGDVFVDAGASVGQMSFHAARAVGASGEVLAFEPAPDRYADLVAGIGHNGLSNVRAYRAGLAADNGELGLYLRGSPSMADQKRTKDTLSVPVRRLDDVLAERSIQRVRFIKIDVEGLEPEVLLGARQLLESPEPPIICYEYGIYRHAKPVHELLPGYALYQLSGTAHRVSPLVEVTPPRIRADNVFAIPRSLLGSLPRSLFAPRALPHA
jgi:FkbM family methyltransferase